MRIDKSTLRRFWKDLGVYFTIAMMFGLVLTFSASFVKVYEDSMHVRQRARLVVSIVDEQKNLLFHEQAGTVSLQKVNAEVVEPSSMRRWIVERFAESNDDPRVVAKDLEKFLNHYPKSAAVQGSLKRWEATLALWGQHQKNAASPVLLVDGRQHYFESAGFRRIGKSFDGTVLDLWTISLLTQFVEKNPLHPAVPEALFMMGDEYMSLGSALPKDANSDRILNLIPELYPDSVWASRANAIWKSERSHEI